MEKPSAEREEVKESRKNNLQTQDKYTVLEGSTLSEDASLVQIVRGAELK